MLISVLKESERERERELKDTQGHRNTDCRKLVTREKEREEGGGGGEMVSP